MTKMLLSFAITLLSSQAFAAPAPAPAPAPQGLDFAAIAALPPASTPSVAVGVASQVIHVNVASLVASVAKAVSTDPITVSAPARKLKRDTGPTSSASVCTGGTPQPTGSGPNSTPDTPAAFASNSAYDQAALNAVTPAGYTEVYKDLDAASMTYYYLGFVTLTSYSPAACASGCNSLALCSSFNIYFERDPSVTPGSGTNCDDPPSTINIKCSYFGGPISSGTATVYGQYRDDFEVLIAGSNGYESDGIPTVPQYTGTYIGNAAINAPLDCNGMNTYLGSRIFNTGPFDPQLCATACSSQTSYNAAHPPSDGSAPQVCRFFNTYMLLENGMPLGQYCSLYSDSYDPTYATNVGQYDQQGNHYTIDDSSIYSLTSDPGFASSCVVNSEASKKSGS